MKEHELVITQLYNVYSQRLPDYREFWQGLSDGEVQHAEIIDALFDHVKDRPDAFVVERFPIPAIEHSIKYIKQLIERAKQPGLDMIDALSMAMDIEQSQIENKYFEVFQGDSSETKRALDMVAQDDREHLETVKLLWQKLR